MNAIEKFIQQQNYRYNPSVLGIIVYGSYLYQQDYSDIDLFILTSRGQNMKGSTNIDGVQIDFCEKTISSLLEEAERLQTSFNMYLKGVFCGGKVIYQRGDMIDYIKEKIENNDVSKSFRRISGARIENIGYLEAMHKEAKGGYQKYIYYNLLDEIRKYYHEANGYSLVSSNKVHRLYQNKEEAEEHYYLKMPPEEFILTYESLLRGYESKQFEKLKTLARLSHMIEEPRSVTKMAQKKEKEELIYESVILSHLLDACQKCYEMGGIDFLSTYYLAVEKLRKLYLSMHDCETFPCDIYSLDASFLRKMHILVEKVDIHLLRDTFLEMTKPFAIDYQNYKVKCY